MTTYTPPPEPGRTPSRSNRPVFLISIMLVLLVFLLLLGGRRGMGAVDGQPARRGLVSPPPKRVTNQPAGLSLEGGHLARGGRDQRLVGRNLPRLPPADRPMGAWAVFIQRDPSAGLPRSLGRAPDLQRGERRADPLVRPLARRGCRRRLTAAGTDQGGGIERGRRPGSQAGAWERPPAPKPHRP